MRWVKVTGRGWKEDRRRLVLLKYLGVQTVGVWAMNRGTGVWVVWEKEWETERVARKRGLKWVGTRDTQWKGQYKLGEMGEGDWKWWQGVEESWLSDLSGGEEWKGFWEPLRKKVGRGKRG